MTRRPDPAPRALPTRREAVAAALVRLAPRVPDFESEAIVDRALASTGLRNAAPETAAWLGLVSYARHVFTEYDSLLRRATTRTAPATSSSTTSTPCWPSGACGGGSARTRTPQDPKPLGASRRDRSYMTRQPRPTFEAR